MKKANLEHVKTVRSKGRSYDYFNTGQKVDGKPVYVRLPFRGSPDYGTAYATQLANRTKRENVKTILTVQGVSEAYQMRGPYSKVSASTRKTYDNYLREIDRLIGQAPITGLERADVRRLVEHKSDAPAAAKMLLVVLRQIIAYAMKQDWLTRDVTEGIDVATDATPYEPWPDAMLERALADPAIRLPVALLYYTDQRISDVCKMRWAHIERGAIAVTQQKTGKTVRIPIHRKLSDILDGTSRSLTSILCDHKGRTRQTYTIRAEIKAWLASQGAGHLHVHGLRKNGLLALFEAGCTVPETASISGQSLTMVEHYWNRWNADKLAGHAMDKWNAMK